MMSLATMRTIALTLLAAGGIVGGAAGADVHGYVGEQFGARPQNALATVTVRLAPVAGAAANAPKVFSDAAGEYQHTAVGNGKYRLVFSKVGYRPYDRMVEVKGQNVPVADVFLWQEKLPANYLGAVAGRYASRAQVKNRKAVYASLWSNMRVVNISPEAKKELVGLLCAKDREAEEAFEPFQQYQRAGVDAIRGVKATFAKAVMGKGELPSREFVTRSGLGPDVVADIVLDELRAVRPSAQKEKFLEEFQAGWGEEKVGQAVLHSTKQDERRMHYLPK